MTVMTVQGKFSISTCTELIYIAKGLLIIIDLCGSNIRFELFSVRQEAESTLHGFMTLLSHELAFQNKLTCEDVQ